MNAKNYNWLGLRKEELIKTLISTDAGRPSRSYLFRETLFNDVDIVISTNPPGTPPAVVIKDEAFGSTMAWLYTYMEEAMPLSIYCDVYTQRDFQLLEDPVEVHSRTPLAWSSIIVGEILARSGTVASLDDVSMAWVNSSYTLPAALAYCCHPSSSGMCREFITRLTAIQDSDRLLKSDFRPDGCTEIWELCNRVGSIKRNPWEAVDFCGSLIFMTREAEGGRLLQLLGHPSFLSNSLEERLRSFDEVLISLDNIELRNADRAFAAAAAAYLVGRGTSHIHLLNGKNNGLSFMWFSLLAAIGGEEAWDSKWMRLLRRIDSHINFFYLQALKGNSQHDLSWREFDWLMNSRIGLEVIRAMVKLVPNFVTVEIVPGVAIQIRVSKTPRDPTGTAPKHDSASERNEQLASMLDELAKSLREAGPSRQAAERLQRQRELDLEASDSQLARRRKRK